MSNAGGLARNFFAPLGDFCHPLEEILKTPLIENVKNKIILLNQPSLTVVFLLKCKAAGV